MGSWSVILNVLLLGGVIIAIARTIIMRRGSFRSEYLKPSIGSSDQAFDDIIAVRKVNRQLPDEAPTFSFKSERESCAPSVTPLQPTISPVVKTEVSRETPLAQSTEPAPSLMMFLLAKEDRQFVGYELLQTLLAAGLRFGEGQLFHRHQYANGQGPVLCSVAAATSSGTFDMQNMGAFSVRGLCVFMETSGNSSIDEERFSIMLDMARQLSDDLDAFLLDDKRQPLTEVALRRYRAILNCAVVSEA